MPRGDQTKRGKPRERVSGMALFWLLLLLVAPALALSRLAGRVDWRVLVGGPVVLSLFSFLAYRSDKRRAEAGEWRIPESTLHLADLIGGWPGGFLAQQIFRHKVAKGSFEVVFWLGVLLHQYVAVDYLLGWRMTREVLGALRSVL